MAMKKIANLSLTHSGFNIKAVNSINEIQCESLVFIEKETCILLLFMTILESTISGLMLNR